MTLTQLLTRLKELHERATPERWEQCGCRFSIVTSYLNPQEILDICDTKISDLISIEESEHNGRLIAEMKNALPLLLEVIETQREALKRAQLGLDLAHSCGSPPDDVSGRQMWEDSQEIRMQTREALARCEKVIQEGMK